MRVEKKMDTERTPLYDLSNFQHIFGYLGEIAGKLEWTQKLSEKDTTQNGKGCDRVLLRL